jgi:hypothetical protein
VIHDGNPSHPTPEACGLNPFGKRLAPAGEATSGSPPGEETKRHRPTRGEPSVVQRLTKICNTIQTGTEIQGHDGKKKLMPVVWGSHTEISAVEQGGVDHRKAGGTLRTQQEERSFQREACAASAHTEAKGGHTQPKDAPSIQKRLQEGRTFVSAPRSHGSAPHHPVETTGTTKDGKEKTCSGGSIQHAGGGYEYQTTLNKVQRMAASMEALQAQAEQHIANAEQQKRSLLLEHVAGLVILFGYSLHTEVETNGAWQ